MLGCDIRKMNEETRKLVTNPDLIRINQDQEARPPIIGHHPWNDKLLILFKHLDDGTYALGVFNMEEKEAEVGVTFSDYGLPASAGYDLAVRDILNGGEEETHREYMRVKVGNHDCRMFIARLVKR